MSAESPMLSLAEARAVVEELKVTTERTDELIARCVEGKAWAALDYPGWNELVAGELPSCRFLKLPREERLLFVYKLADRGLGNRMIAPVAGISERTVRRDLARAAFAARGRRLGRDGKTYPPRPTPKPVPVTDLFSREPVELDAVQKPVPVVREEPAPPRPPVERDYTPEFVMAAKSLRLNAAKVSALHKHAKTHPNKTFADGMTAVREAVAVLQAVLADD